MDRANERRREKKRQHLQNDSDEDNSLLDLISFDDFLEAAVRGSEEPNFEMKARVDIKMDAPVQLDARKRADKVAEVVGHKLMLHWT